MSVIDGSYAKSSSYFLSSKISKRLYRSFQKIFMDVDHKLFGAMFKGSIRYMTQKNTFSQPHRQNDVLFLIKFYSVSYNVHHLHQYDYKIREFLYQFH